MSETPDKTDAGAQGFVDHASPAMPVPSNPRVQAIFKSMFATAQLIAEFDGWSPSEVGEAALVVAASFLACASSTASVEDMQERFVGAMKVLERYRECSPAIFAEYQKVFAQRRKGMN